MAEFRDDRSFTNPYSDDIGDDKSQVLDEDRKMLSRKYKEAVEKNIKILLVTWETGIAAKGGRSDYSVYTGTSGYALLYLRLYQYYEEEKYLVKAKELLQHNLRHLKRRDVTFMIGDPGPLALAAWLYHSTGRKDKCDTCIVELLKFRGDIVALDRDQEDELLYGRAGYLYALLFLYNNQVGADVLTEGIVSEVVGALVASGVRTAKKKRSVAPLMYYWHDKDYVGAAHGLIGILFMLLQARQHLAPGVLEGVVRGTVDYVCGLQQTSGNLPSSLSNTTDRLVHWCHGAPGAVFLFAKAFQVFKDEKYLVHAKKAGECVWARGLLQKGYGLCHGSAGNGYALLYLYQVTGEVLYLYRAGQFGVWCQDYGTHGCHQPDRPLSFYEGLAGNLSFLLDLHHPKQAKFPAFVL